MSEIQAELPPLEERPLVTFALFAYNQEKYIREAIEGAFAQTYEPLEIILSDDRSTDRTFEIMEEMAKSYVGPHRVTVRQNSHNLGIADHFNTVIGIAKGDILTAAAGDDISLPERTIAAVREFVEDKNITFVESALYNFSQSTDRRLYRASSDSRLFKLEDFVKRPGLGLVGAGRSYRRRVLLSFAPLISDCPTEDSTSLLRALLIGPGKYMPFPLVLRRIHENNVSRPNAIPARKLEAIRIQYQVDIEWAVGKGLIEKIRSEIIRKNVIRYINSRVLIQKKAEGAGPLSIILYGVRQGGIGIHSIKAILRALIR